MRFKTIVIGATMTTVPKSPTSHTRQTDRPSTQSSACYKIQCGEFYHLEAHDLERAARELRSHMGKPELPDDDAADLAAAANALDRCAAEWEGVYGLL